MTKRWKLGRVPKVCVVGAGFSGLSCAEMLGRHGLDVDIVEARNRVGGRVHQVNMVDHWIDMGANWIHGERVNPIRDLAQKVGAVTANLDERTLLYDETGHLVPELRAEKLESVTWGILEEALKYSRSGADIPITESLYDYIVDQVKQKDLSEADQKLVLQMSEIWGGYIGSPVQRQSLKYLFLDSVSLEGENSFIVSTYRDILHHVETQALKHAAIYLDTEVTSISTTSENETPGVSIEVNISDFRAQLMPTLRPFDTYDAVVVTIPFGCLQEGQVTFSPKLPAQLNHAISSITYGNLEKVYIHFPRPFWVTSGDPQPFFAHFLHPVFTTENPSHWDIDILSLAGTKLAEKSLQSTLLFYIYGPSSKHVTELVAGLKQSDPQYRSRLADFFKPYYSRLPNYDAQDPACRPVIIVATDWQHDRFAGHGSYTNWQIDDNDKLASPPKMPLDDAILTLRQGLPDRNLYFAGEHTAPFAEMGTVTGAYSSGQAVAKRIVERFRVDENVEDPGQLTSGTMRKDFS